MVFLPPTYIQLGLTRPRYTIWIKTTQTGTQWQSNNDSARDDQSQAKGRTGLDPQKWSLG